MKKTTIAKAVTTATIALTLGALSATTLAHQTYSEKERERKSNFRDNGNLTVDVQDGEDLDFEHPFDITQQTSYKSYVPFPPFEITQYPRQDAAIAVDSTLRGIKDVDVFKYTKIGTNSQIMSAYPIVPYCRNIEEFQPVIALAGPMGVLNDDGEAIFQAPDDDVPQAVVDGLPAGYGIKVVRHEDSDLAERPTYYSPHGFNMWFLPKGIHDGECIEGLNDLEGINAIRTGAGEPACEVHNTIYEKISVPGEYYYITWHEDAEDDYGYGYGHGWGWWGNKRGKNYRHDYSLVTGTIDQFQDYDWARVFARAGENSWGGNLSYNCKLPTTAPIPFEIPEEEDHDHD